MNLQPASLNPLFRFRRDRPSVHLHIRRLSLDGLPVNRTQGALVPAVVGELTRLLAESGLTHSSIGAVPHLSANSIQVSRDGKPAQLGHEIAQAIYGSLTPTSVLTHEAHLPGGSPR